MMKCIKCGIDIPPNSRRIKYCSDRCGRSFLKAVYRKNFSERLKAKRRTEEERGLTCIVCGGSIPLESKSKQYCDEFCARKNYKRAYFRKHREDVLSYNRKFRKLKANGNLQKIFEREECYFCGSDHSLISHHTEYSPTQKLIRMCASCHRKLHRLLKYRNTSSK